MNSKTIFILIIIIVVGLAGWLMLKNKGEKAAVATLTPTPIVMAETSPSPAASPNMEIPEKVAVTMETVRGTIELELYSKAAPKTVLNFLSLARKGFYDGTKFHRVIADFVIQGGDPLSKTNDPKTGTGGPGYQFEDEINPKILGLSDSEIAQLEAAGYKYDFSLPSLPVDVGVMAMANAGPGTNGSQFFIVTTQPQPHLNGKHTVFGRVVKGMNVVLKIKQGDIVKKITTDYKPAPSPSLSPSPPISPQ